MRNNSDEAKTPARALRQDMSPAEALLWHHVRRSRLGFMVKRQVPIGRYILDFYVASAKLCIEVDGSEHEQRRPQDLERDRFLAAQRIRTFRVDASDLVTRMVGVLQDISIAAHPI